jgi:arylsulfatase A-like enzyme
MSEVLERLLRKVQIFIISIPFLFLVNCKQVANDYSKSSKPNIVLFVADDAGWHDVGYHGSEINTPNIDKLAEDGVELNQFYVYPTCSPSRAALLTGKYASRFGIGEPIAMKSKQVLPTDVETLPEALKKEGYQTAITGKWHLGLNLESGPSHYGFDYTYGYLHGQIDQYAHRYKNGDSTWYRNNKFVNEEGHVTDLITKEAIKYIKEIRDKSKPFFIYVPYSVPHYPLQEEEKWIEPYRNLNDVYSRKLFDASMTHMDYSIGEIIQTLKNEKLLDNTIVVFISDNGGQENWYPEKESKIKLYDGKFGPYPKLGDNSPLRGYKAELYEGGIRVPAVIYWKNHLKHNKVGQLIKVTDLFPTIASLVDSSLTQGVNLDGKNMWNVISNQENVNEEREIYLRTPDQFALRKGGWKLIHFGKTLDEGREELYNLKNDPYETKNVVKDYPKVRNELFKELENQIKFDPGS